MEWTANFEKAQKISECFHKRSLESTILPTVDDGVVGEWRVVGDRFVGDEKKRAKKMNVREKRDDEDREVEKRWRI